MTTTTVTVMPGPGRGNGRDLRIVGGPHDHQRCWLSVRFKNGDVLVVADTPSASHHPTYELDEAWLVFAGWRVAH